MCRGKGEGDRPVYENTDLTWDFLSVNTDKAAVMYASSGRLNPQWVAKINGDNLVSLSIAAVCSSLRMG